MKRRTVLLALCVMLILSTALAPVSASASVVGIMKINVQGARLRKGPSSAYDVIKSLKKGTRVFYGGKKINAFCYVCTSSGRRGYVYKRFLTPYGAVQSKQVYYTKGKLALYKKASGSSGRKSTLSKHQFVLVYETRGNWAYVKTLSGKGGFVRLGGLAKA